MTKKLSLENQIVGILSDEKMGKSDLKRYCSQIAGLQKQRFVVDHVCKYGQPHDHGVCVSGHLKVSDLKSLLNILTLPGGHRFEIFPYGIINPEALNIKFRIGPENVGR